MKLYEIIAFHEGGQIEEGNSILLELLPPYKKSLCTYFKRYYGDPVILVTSVFNTGAYGFIVPANSFNDAIEAYLQTIPDMNEEDKEAERETISFNSRMLKDI